MDATAQDLIARLRRNPDDAEAFGALRAHYHRQGDYASLVNLLEGWAARTTDGPSSAQAFYDAGEMVRTYLSDRGRAMSLYERALERSGLHMEASTRLQELLEEVGDHRRILDVLEKRAEALAQANADPRHTAQVHQQIGEVWEQQFQRVDRAIHHYRKAFELDPTLVTAIYAAREIYRNAGNLKAAASLYDLEANAETDGERKVALLRELGHLRAEQLGDLEGAIVALKRALNQSPADLAVMHDLATILIRRADHAADPESAHVDRERAADLLYQMAQAVPADHGLAYAEAALDAAPDHDGAMELLERLAGELGREDLLPIRWVAYLQVAPDAPGADHMRRRLGHAYLEAGQIEDAIVCYEPLLEKGDPEAAERLVQLYRDAGRQQDVVHALSVAVRGLPPERRIPRLREIIQIHEDQGEHDEAAARAKEILEIDPGDPDALTFLEDHLRKRGEHAELRDLMLAAARVPGLSVESRKLRLREVASLSENKLEDLDGAISAWRGVTALDPADQDARHTLERLLEETGRWDELVQVLERDALSVTDPEAKGVIYRRMAHIHRNERGNLMEAIEALRSLRDIRPGDEGARDELCDVLLEAGAHLEAVPLLRQRVDSASDKEQRVALLRTLSGVLEEHIGDDEGAFEASARLLDEEPGDLDTLARMERIDRRNEDWHRLLETLSYRVEVAPAEERADILAEMGAIADQHLGDLDRAVEHYGRAMEVAPDDTTVLDALCDVYDRSERYRDLVVLLRERAQLEDDPDIRAELYRRIARTLAHRVRNEDAAAEAWHEVLESGEDAEALGFLAELARRREETAELSSLLGRLDPLVEDLGERRDLLMERSSLLGDALDRKTEAIEALRVVLDQIDSSYLPALSQLAMLCEDVGDLDGLADALERQLEVVEDDGLRVPVAQRLSDLYERELSDAPRAIDALYAWADADLTDPEPQRRLVKLLDEGKRWADLLSALDSLAGIEQSDEEVSALTLRAANLALDELGDVDGAWDRLVPRVEEGDEGAEERLREVARETGRGEMLAELYVRLAQTAVEADEQYRRWNDAARVFEEYLADPQRALEAELRAFAVDLHDESTLAQVDRLASEAGAWDRLAQVYDTLLRKQDDPARKVELLVRHARILDEGAGQPSEALDQVLRACSLLPDDDEVLAFAEDLAPRAGRAEELFIVYDRRRSLAEDDTGRVAALMRAARLADLSLDDRDRAMQYVAQSVSLAARSPEAAEPIEETIRVLDDERPELGPQAARRMLVDIYRQLAERAAEDEPDAGARLLVWAGRIVEHDLNDDAGGFDYMTRAASFSPGNTGILDELEELAERTGRFPELAERLGRLVEEALDQATAAELLKRQGRVLEIELESFSKAADVYAQLLALKVTDPAVPRRLRSCLRRAGRHQDLLLVLDREMERTADQGRQIVLLKEVAVTWESDLKNRWEALDAWNKVLSIEPQDEEALDAVKRLGHATRRLSPDEVDALDEASDHELLAPPEGAPGPLSPVEVTGEHTDPGIPSPGSAVFDIDDDTESEAPDDVVPSQDERALLDAFDDEESTEKRPSEAPMGGSGRGERGETRPLDGSDFVDEPLEPTGELAVPQPTGGTDELDLDDAVEVAPGGTGELDLDDAMEVAPGGTGELDLDDAMEVAPGGTGELDLDDAVELSGGDAQVLEDAGGFDDASAGQPVASSLEELGSHFDEHETMSVDDLEVEDISGLVEMPADDGEPLDDDEIEELDAMDLLDEEEPASPQRTVPPPPPGQSVPPPLPPMRGSSAPPPPPAEAQDDAEEDRHDPSIPPPLPDR